MDKIICGLGNPGLRYEDTRHNCGFMAADTLCEKLRLPPPKKLKFKSLTCTADIDGVKCFIMKPATYMNLSGEAVAEALNFYKLETKDLIVVYDDVSLPLGKIRIRENGTDGGHNGIKNIIYLTGKDDFPRVKIGIKPENGTMSGLIDYVTSPFTKAEGKLLEPALGRAAEAVLLMARGQTVRAMNEFNSKT